MQPNQITKWLTLGANVGVLIGIMLLIYELDQNHNMMQAQIRNDVSQNIVEFLSLGAADTAVASVKRRAEAGEEISADEEHQYYLMMAANLRIWENLHYQYRHGLFDEDEFQGEKRTWRVIINKNKAFSRNWCIGRAFYSAEFTAEIDALLEDNPCVEK